MSNVLLWIDDERDAPEWFTHWAKTSQAAIDMLEQFKFQGDVLIHASFDHDLGYSWEDGHSSLDNNVQDDNSRRIAQWMVDNNYFPEAVTIHTQNPIGANYLMSLFRADGPQGMMVIRRPYNPKDYE